MRSLSSGIGALVLVAVLGITGRAAAQAADHAVAEALFEKGRAAMDAEDFATACAAFEESNRLQPAPGTMANLANCEDRRGHLASAQEWYLTAASQLPQGDERRTIAEQRAAEIKVRMPMLTIRLAPGTPASARVLRDATELRSVSLGLPLPIDPGDHQIVVTMPGSPEGRYAVHLEEKEVREIVVGPGTNPPKSASPAAAAPAAGPAKPPPPAPTAADAGTESPSNHQFLGYVLIGAGGLGVGTALVLGAVALGKKSTVSDHCDTSTRTCDNQAAADAASAGETLTTASTVSFIVGAAAAGAGLYFVLSSKNDASVGTTALPGGGLLRFAQRF
jgi:hypothetical protein